MLGSGSVKMGAEDGRGKEGWIRSGPRKRPAGRALSQRGKGKKKITSAL